MYEVRWVTGINPDLVISSSSYVSETRCKHTAGNTDANVVLAGARCKRGRTMRATPQISEIDRVIYDVDGSSGPKEGSSGGNVREEVKKEIKKQHEAYLATLMEKLSGRELDRALQKVEEVRRKVE